MKIHSLTQRDTQKEKDKCGCDVRRKKKHRQTKKNAQEIG